MVTHRLELVGIPQHPRAHARYVFLHAVDVVVMVQIFSLHVAPVLGRDQCPRSGSDVTPIIAVHYGDLYIQWQLAHGRTNVVNASLYICFQVILK